VTLGQLWARLHTLRHRRRKETELDEEIRFHLSEETEERVASVEGCRYVDEVVPNAPLTIDREWIEKHGIDLILHGDDFSSDLERLCYQIPMEMGIYRTIGYTEGISTSEIIARIKAVKNE